MKADALPVVAGVQEPGSKKEKFLARKLAKKRKAQTVHQGVTVRQNRKMAEVLEQLRKAAGCNDRAAVPDESVPALVRAAFGVQVPYGELEREWGASDVTQGCDMLADCAMRPPLYQEKMLPQELSLLRKMFRLMGGRQPDATPATIPPGAPDGQPTGGETPVNSGCGSDVAVVDLGAGNGCLALQCVLTLNCTAVLIDRAAPFEQV